MSRFASRYRELPASVLFMLLVFLVIPLWSLTFLEAPSVMAARDGWPLAATRIFAYVAGPLTLAATLLLRHFLFIPLFALECAGLLYLLVVGEQTSEGGAASVFRMVALAVAAVLGLVLANKDLLMPFLGKTSRSWRKTPRLAANARLSLGGDGKQPIRAMMEDLSATGLAVACEAEAGRDALAGTELGGVVDVSFHVGTKEIPFKAVVVRRKLEEGFLRLGLSVSDEDAMSALWDAVDTESQRFGMSGRMRRVWIRSSTRRVALGVWAIAMAGAYGSPACGQMSKSKRSGGGSALVDEEARSIIEDAYIYRGPVESASEDHGFHGGERPSSSRGFQPGAGRSQVAFTGDETSCDNGAAVERAGELWSQSKLLAAYAPAGGDYFATMLRSFQESEPSGLRRPKLPIHQDLVNRLGGGTMGHGWVLNLVRLRDDHIKLNYELDLRVAQPHLIAFAAVIHALQIHPDDLAAYQDEQAAFAGRGPHGCALIAFLKRWIPRTSYKFAHTNIFDTGLLQPTWRFAEAKVTLDVSPSPSDPRALQLTGDLANRYGQGVADGRMLTIVPMRFDRYRKVNGQLVKQGADRAFLTWKSDGIDEADTDPNGRTTKNQKFINDGGRDLLEPDVNGAPVAADDPVRACDETMTCAACHAATTDAAPGAGGGPLARIPANNFRHIGFGLDAPFGVPRPHGKGVYSKWFERLQGRASCGTVIK